LPSKHSSGCQRATEEEDDQRTPGREIWRCGHQYSWRKMEATAQNRAADGEEWSVAYYTLDARRLKLNSSEFFRIALH